MGGFDDLLQKYNKDFGDDPNTVDQVVTSVKDVVTSVLNENAATATPSFEISSTSSAVTDITAAIQESVADSILEESLQNNSTMLEIGQNSTSFMETLQNTTNNLNEMFAANNTISMVTTPSTVLQEITENGGGIVANTSASIVEDVITTENIATTIQSEITTIDPNHLYGLDNVEDMTLYIVLALIIAIAIIVITILLLIYRKYRANRSQRLAYCVTPLQEVSVSNDNCKPQYSSKM